MKAHEVATELRQLLLDGSSDVLREHVEDVTTFADAELLTRDAGVVVTMVDGSEFQLTVVKSASARRGDPHRTQDT
jgi:hypothetical protein